MFRNTLRMVCAAAAGIALTVSALPAALAAGPAAQPGTRLWVARYSSPGRATDGGAAVAVSPDGSRVFVTGGSSVGTWRTDYATVAYSTATGGQLWAARYTSGYSDSASAIAVSPDGSRVFVTGTSWYPGEGSDYQTIAYNAATGKQLWVARYSSYALGVHGHNAATAIAVSPDGSRVFVTGQAVGYDIWAYYATLAYSASTGKRLWLARYSRTGGIGGRGIEAAYALAVSPDGSRVFVTGESWAGPSPTAGTDYATVAYRASTGARIWAKRYHGPGTGSAASSLAVGNGGQTVFVTGRSRGARSGFDYATVAYRASTGAWLWVKRYNGPGNGEDRASSIAVTPSGTRVFVTGYSRGTTSRSDYATVAYSASTGAWLWVRRYNGNGNGNAAASCIAVSPGGRTVFVTGYSYGGTVTNLDYATIAYDSRTGTRLWVSRYYGPGNGTDAASAIAVNRSGNRVFVTGSSYSRATHADYATIAYSS